MVELWVVIEEFPMYQISNLGRVIGPGGRNQKSKILKTYPNAKGYPRVSLMKNGKAITINIHKLVLTEFVGPRPGPNWDCDHIDFNKNNNCVENLRWMLRSKNSSKNWIPTDQRRIDSIARARQGNPK